MILGISISAFVTIHVAISLIGIVGGLVVLYGLLHGNRMEGWTLLFLATTVATSVTGFLFPITVFTPALGLGVLSMIVLVPTIVARYALQMRGASRWIYVAGAVISLYFNCFVLVVQSFLKIQILNDLAPTGTELPFVIAQGALLIAFIIAGALALRRFHPAVPMLAARA